MAEHTPASLTRGAAAAPAVLRARLGCTFSALDRVRDAAAGVGNHAGSIAALDETAARAKREAAGRLYDDCAITLTRLGHDIGQVERDLALTSPPDTHCG